jgi:hypothetical protein
MQLHIPFGTAALTADSNTVEIFLNAHRSCSEPAESIIESRTDQDRMTTVLDEEPFPPPKTFNRCCARSKTQPRSINKIVHEKSGYNFINGYPVRMPTTRPVHNRSVGQTLLEAERNANTSRQNHDAQRTSELDILLCSL